MKLLTGQVGDEIRQNPDDNLCLKLGIVLWGLYLSLSNLNNPNVSAQEKCYATCPIPPLAGHLIGTGGLASNSSCMGLLMGRRE